MEKTKAEIIKEVEDAQKAADELLVKTLTEAIMEDIEVFKNLPEKLRTDRDIAKAAFSAVGATVWFQTEGLTINQD